mmetsp:Transcript_21861/g.39862  ORF Transcript_21861/g.39862 Transcript_21861/m.39862 type:complete len:339 (+) Transcript_21861:1727-2743(+)|eukprot:CAMPEP_0204898678 /NCGR_PEP_ID=MMETSP1397-20131031/1424_1 /ASSEMBLY_ACC=CAM_ASM_000891 /TAXON_ID=49980 /ORGANISM="Climacostomum Climacostomum virens, Strain Stock W-24" /LENGTH=338 /DNA_ID=CAMNT_0052066561 /DNA_START=288 /DNA_END=1304 /DNA_ORIENTATION=-
MDPENLQQDKSSAEGQPESTEATLASTSQETEEVKAEDAVVAVTSEVHKEEPKDDEGDSEIEDLKEQELNAEAKIAEQPEAVRPIYQKLLDNQRARDNIYQAYLAELRAINLRYEPQYFEFFNKRTELADKVDDFWLTVLKNNPITGETIVTKDEPLLRFLKNVTYTEAKHGRYTELIFEFAENPFIVETRLVKPFEIDSDEQIQSKEGTKITWKGEDFTMQELKTKKKKKGKPVRHIIKLVPRESFFNLFKSSEDIADSGSDEDEDNFDDDDIEICLEIKDEIIPYAFLWYTKARSHEHEHDNCCDSEEEADAKESIKAMAAKPSAAGTNPADCKNQ